MTQPPTLYGYYTSGGIATGLSASQPTFTLNNKEITLYSGALHYFRVPPAYWRDRLRKMRAAGLNAVETYVPWNLHQPEMNVFDFGNGKTDFSQFLDIEQFIKTAQEEDLFVIVRPGPYICAEWDFGGLPSWLLRFDKMNIRTSDEKYIELVRKYFNVLLPLLVPLQFTKGGPIIAVQIENEYGNVKVKNEPIDTNYLATLKQILLDNNIVELLFTSDTPSRGFYGTLPDVLATANFQTDPSGELKLLKDYQPDKPLMVMEYWSGWFDHWTEKHNVTPINQFGKVLEEILSLKSSVNMYMFHGGTNWGFLNGANLNLTSSTSGYEPDTSSYDYDAPLSESGDYTDKYLKVKELIQKYNKVVTFLPKQPALIKRAAYPSIKITKTLSLDDLIKQSHNISSQKLVPMELLKINNSSGQSYGYIIYRKKNLNIIPNSVLKIEGHVCDTIMVLINGELKSKILKGTNDFNEFGYWRMKNSILNLGQAAYNNATLDLVVENWGRVNYGKLHEFKQHKGLWQGNVLINNTVLENWDIIPLEFKKKWTNSLKDWKPAQIITGPALYQATLEVKTGEDTYIDMRDWKKGIIIVNGFVLSRYLRLGPQQTAYLPGPLLEKGPNTILIFEHFTPSTTLKFVSDPVFETLTTLK